MMVGRDWRSSKQNQNNTEEFDRYLISKALQKRAKMAMHYSALSNFSPIDIYSTLKLGGGGTLNWDKAYSFIQIV